jgi:hypothetical protein
LPHRVTRAGTKVFLLLFLQKKKNPISFSKEKHHNAGAAGPRPLTRSLCKTSRIA